MKVYLDVYTVTNERNPLKLCHICSISSNSKRRHVETVAVGQRCVSVGFRLRKPWSVNTENTLPLVEEHLALLV